MKQRHHIFVPGRLRALHKGRPTGNTNKPVIVMAADTLDEATLPNFMRLLKAMTVQLGAIREKTVGNEERFRKMQ